MNWPLKSSDGVEYFEHSPDPHLLLAFFTRRGGVSRGDYESLNTSLAVGDDTHHVEENLARARRALRLPAILTVKQTHSDTALHITNELTPSELLEGDACFTDRAGLGLGLKVADCLPVYIYAEGSNCIGIAHCGWRGTAARLAEKTARRMSRRFEVPLTDLRFALGPCICPKCYDVGEDVRAEFAMGFANTDQFFRPIEVTRARNGQAKDPGRPPSSDFVSSWPSTSEAGPKYLLDIRAANRWLLTELGLVETISLELCTLETKNLCYSVRRDKMTGRNLALIALH